MQNSQIPENWNRNDGGGASIRPGSFLEVSVTDSDADLSMKIAETEFFLAVHNSSIGDLVTQSVSQGTFTFDLQRATLETCDL